MHFIQQEEIMWVIEGGEQLGFGGNLLWASKEP
jgi:hypothetical protein